MTHRKKKFTVYGNCQAPALAKFLGHYESFSDSYEYIDVKQVNIMTDKDISVFHTVIPELDLLIYQPISNSYKNNPMFGHMNIINKLKSKCIHISFPVCFFLGYHSELTTIKNTPAVFTFNDQKTEFLVHDKNIVRYFLENKSIDEIASLISKRDYYSVEFLTANLRQTIDELRRRELQHNIDVPISKFIEDNYTRVKLFRQFNHPRYELFVHISKRILSILNLSTESSFYFDPLHKALSVPLYPSTYANLGVEFTDIDHYMIRGQVMTKREVIAQYCEGYNSIDRQVLEDTIADWNPY